MRWGEQKAFPLSVPLFIPDEAFMRLTLPEDHLLQYSRKTVRQEVISISTYSSNCSGAKTSAPWTTMAAAISLMDRPVLSLMRCRYSRTSSGTSKSMRLGKSFGSSRKRLIFLLSSIIGQHKKRTAIGTRSIGEEWVNRQARGWEDLKSTALTEILGRRSANGCAQGHRAEGKLK